MSRITILDTPTVTLWYHSDKKIVHHQLHGFIYGDAFRELLLAGLDLIKKHRAQKWLSDDTKNTVLAQEDPPQEWVRDNFIAPCIQAGWRYWAIVRPAKILAQMGMDRVAELHAQLGLTVKFFHDPVSAMVWLEKQ